MKWVGYLCEPFDEPSIKVGEAQEQLDIPLFFRRRPFGNSPYFLWVIFTQTMEEHVEVNRRVLKVL